MEVSEFKTFGGKMSNRYPERLFSKDGVRKLLLLKHLYNSEDAVGIEELVFA